MKSILLLGGTGVLGQSLIHLLEEKDIYVFVTSRKVHENTQRVTYIQGNAHDLAFLQKVLSERHFDAVIDFIRYGSNEFKERVGIFLTNTLHYIFISSSRVYADNKLDPITEKSPRLLEISDDVRYLESDEYALAKAKEENVLIESKYKNWTIVRPYITYGVGRLQLGIYEKEEWLYRALLGKPIVFSEDVCGRLTSMVHSDDVARAIICILKNGKNTFSEIYHVAGSESIMWSEVLDLYKQALETVLGKPPLVFMTKDTQLIQPGSLHQLKKDRLYDRVFSIKKIEQLGYCQQVELKQGLTSCVIETARKAVWENVSWWMEAVMDRLSSSKQKLREIPGIRNKVIYAIFRYCPIIAHYLLKFLS